MSLRLKFLILVAGSVLVPVVVMLLSFGLTRDGPTLEQIREQTSYYYLWRTSLSELSLDERELESAFSMWPRGFSILVLDDAGNTLYTRGTVQGLHEGSGLRLVETEHVTFTSGRPGTLVMSVRADFFRKFQDRFYVPLAGLLFFAITAALIGQSMNRSIANLERATSRIAAGDLDFELKVRGNDKLASLTRSFDSMRLHLKEEYARRSRFIMGISHDLKTPLASITGYVAAIRDGYADTPQKLDRYTAIIGRKASLLESRLSMLIDYVRRDTSEWSYTMRPVDLTRFLRDFARLFEMEASLKGRSVTAVVSLPEPFTVTMDTDMVIRALENLAHNALEHSPADTPVSLHASLEGDTARVAIANGGPGIPREDLDAVFEPFVRLSRDRKGAGLGLGLATVRSVVAAHGWRVEAHSKPGVQTVFTITIPAPYKL